MTWVLCTLIISGIRAVSSEVIKLKVEAMNITNDHMEHYVNTELTRRMVLHVQEPLHFPEPTKPPEEYTTKDALRYDKTPIYYQFDVSYEHTKEKTREGMRHIVYRAQDRLKALNPIIERRKNNEKFRMGFVFKQLEFLINEMYIMYSFNAYRQWWLPISQKLFYYNHMLKHHIDITYMVEYLFAYYTVKQNAVEVANMRERERRVQGLT